MAFPWTRTKTWITGEVLTAADLNGVLTDVIANSTPANINDYSATTTEMQTTTDPYPAASPSLATSLSGEFERMRYLIKQATGKSQWYIDPDTSLANVPNGYLDVKGQGAVGDGSTDDTSAINAAMTAAVAAGKTLFFPPGTYKVTGSLAIVSNLRIVGSGRYATTISLPQSNLTTFDFSMFETSGNVSNVSFESIGLRGNQAFQTTGFTNGSLDGWAISFAGGSATNIIIRDCYIHAFGKATDAGQGGIINLIPNIGVSDSTLDNINILDNHFGTSHGVPGVYVAPCYGVTGKGIGCNISRNRFDGGGAQNCVYVLGSTANPAYNVNVDNNEFVLLGNVDTCVEFNGVLGGSISANTFRNTSTGAGTGVLLRGDSINAITTNYLVVAGNTFIHQNSTTKTAISVVGFDAAAHQDHLIICNNMIVDYGLGSSGEFACQIGAGSNNVTFVNNQITTTGGTTVQYGLKVGGFTDVTVKNNLFKNINVPILIAAGSNLTVKDNIFDTCGTNGNPLIATTGGTIALTGFLLIGNHVYSSVSGTTALADINTVATTGNIAYGNISDVAQVSATTHWAIAGNLLIDQDSTARTIAATYSFASAPVLSSLTASTVPYLGTGKALTSSAVTPTQLSYVDATSSIQTQLDAKVALTGNQTVAGTKTFSSTIAGSVNGNAATVTTNANLTGPITSSGNATSIASQTGTGTTFVTQAGPTFTGTTTIPTADITTVSHTGGTAIKGINTNTAASAGDVGEVISSKVLFASRSGLTTNTSANITSITLTAGDWDIKGAIGYLLDNTTSITGILGSISTTSATPSANSTYNSPNTSGEYRMEIAYGAGTVLKGDFVNALNIPTYSLKLTGSVTFYLVVNAVFTVAALNAWGFIEARRTR